VDDARTAAGFCAGCGGAGVKNILSGGVVNEFRDSSS
jgi:hypothetical protein